MARLALTGMTLSLPIPMLTATVRLVATTVHEPALIAKAFVMGGASLMIGYAPTL